MNKRILDLAIDHFCKTEYDGGLTHECYEFSEEELIKFSNAIVMSCASIVSLYRRDNMQDKAIADTLEAAYQEIKLSFGLK